MSENGRAYQELTEEDIKKFEIAYTSDPRPIREICKELNIKYSTYVYIKDMKFPEAVRYSKKPDKEAIMLQRFKLTKKDLAAIKNKYIKTQTHVKDIREEYGLTKHQFRELHRVCFPEWSRKKDGLNIAYRKDASEIETLRTKQEVKKDLAWLKEHWNWKSPAEQSAMMKKKRAAESKYRVVYKGEKALRTPYRPDGRFH